MTVPLSVIVITKNEERNIAACLESASFADEVIVVDAQSTDGTVDIARRHGAEVFVEPWRGFAGAKQFALERTSHEWVLWLDADERIPEETAGEIRLLLAGRPQVDAFRIARRAYFLGKWIRHSGWYPGYVVRLFRKSGARFTSTRVHEGLEIAGPIGTLRTDLLHYTDETLEQYFEKLNSYTTLAAADLADRGRRASWADLVLRPSFLFVKMYVLRLGFLDGWHGFLLARLSAAYVFTKYAKLRARRFAGRI